MRWAIKKVGALITDNARNIFNLLFKDLVNIPSISRISAQYLKEVQLNSNNKEVQLLSFSETRWGYICISLEFYKKNKDYLQAAVLHHKICPLIDGNLRKLILDEDSFWPKVINAHQLLKPVADSILQIESDKPNIELIRTLLKNIDMHFHNVTDLPSSDLTDIKNNILKIFEQRCMKFILHPVQLAAIFFDYARKYYTLNEEENEAVDSRVDYKSCNEPIIELKSGLWARPSVWINKNIAPLTWWKGFFSNRPLYQIAKIILNLPATTASAERNWKTYTHVHTKKPNKLTIDRAMKLVYVKYNLNIFNDD
ncbi:hypothetical protein NQ315_000042 [Exocentrus adspersus]|uniref:HAT C-terminal dimerisation domain-containing protein n=1 Tax=Exocentrus adspersus TaxID=1586481 RepID=A0AAV8VFW5_9CUCU|nr:hypothetical protein NQ315_000042 [Exocentrus adspersus]